MKKFFLFFAFAVCTLTLSAQKKEYTGFPSLVWPKLYDVKYVKAKDANGEYEKPVFSDAAKSLNGKSVTVPGYIVPFEAGNKSAHLMLSSLPLNACFFCGAGGPESVIEVFLKKEISYTEKPMEFRGVIKINDKNPDKMMYIMEQAEVVGEAGF